MAMVDSTHPEGLKLEKKVAQLTKVVVFLNKRSEEAQRDRGLLSQQHEEELQMILGHARTRLDRFEQKLAEVGSPELLLDALTTKMRGVAQERVDKAVAQIRDQGNVREGEYVTNLRARTKELVAVQEQAAAMQQRIENAVAATAATTAKEIAAITAEHEKERIQLKADEVTLQGKIEALELKCATLRVRTEAAEAVKVQMGETATKLANARKAEESLRASASQATAQIAAKDSDLSAATTLVAELEKKLATTTALATSHASESARLSSMLDETTAAHVAVTDEHQRRISEHAEGIRARTSENERLSRELAETQEAHELDRECLRRELAEKEARHSETVNNLENDLHTIRTSTSATVNEAERESTLRESKLLQSLRNSKQETKRVHEELTASLAKESKSLQQRHSMQLQEFRNAWDRDRQVMVEQHSRELATAAGSSSCAAVDVQLANEDVSRLEHEVRVATARTNELETAMQTATATLAEMIARADRLESDLAARTDELDQLRDAHMTTCRELEAALVSGAHSESARTTQFEDEIAAMKTAVASAEARTAELARTHDDALAAAKDRHAKLLARTTKELEEKHLTTRKSMQETVDGLYVELGQSATELEAAEEQRRTSLKDLEQRLAREAKEREEKQIADALSKLSSSAQTDAAAAQEQMERECTARDAEIKALQKALLDARAECETDVSNAHAEAAEKLQCELDEANARGAAAAADLKAAHAAENERLRQESKAAVEAAHLAKADELTAQETAWKQRRDTAVHETRKSVVSEAECASAQRIAEVEEIHRLALAAAQADIESVQLNATTLVQARDEASRKITELEKSLSETDTKILALGTEVEQKGGELLGQRREFTEQLATLRGEADVLVEQHKIEMERLVTGYSTQIDELKEDVVRSEAMSKAKLAIFEEEFRKAELEFESRKSVEADVNRIIELESKLAETLKKTQQLAKLNKQYALEVQEQDKTMHVMLKGDAPTLANHRVLPRVGGKATVKRRGPRGSGLPK